MITEDDTDQIFHALAHSTRRRILDLVRARSGQTVGELARAFDVSRIAVMNHLAVLETAGLIVSQKDGRARRLYFNPVPIRIIYDRWTDEYSTVWAERVANIKYAAERARRGRERDTHEH